TKLLNFQELEIAYQRAKLEQTTEAQARQQAELERAAEAQARQQAEEALQNAISPLLSLGLTIEQIAEALNLSVAEVNRHV
ncbi:MAG: Uma2 family endonuclease, partial [Moorea sp. SIO3B2]|nr:Uma2 family endonuclease [Moorena sp. SIO3B2]